MPMAAQTILNVLSMAMVPLVGAVVAWRVCLPVAGRERGGRTIVRHGLRGWRARKQPAAVAKLPDIADFRT